MMTKRRQIVLVALLAPLGTSIIWLLISHKPTPSSFYPKCAFHELTGLHCPGCGATRAAYAILRGDIVDAIHYNAMFVIGIPVTVAAVAVQRWRFMVSSNFSQRVAWAMFYFWMIYCFARNVPSPTTSWLAPPAQKTPAEQNPRLFGEIEYQISH